MQARREWSLLDKAWIVLLFLALGAVGYGLILATDNPSEARSTPTPAEARPTPSTAEAWATPSVTPVFELYGLESGVTCVRIEYDGTQWECFKE